MQITISNIGKISSATLELRGITVIVGDNNTGKSTIGRCLYGFFNSLCGIDDEIDYQRKRQLFREIRSLSDSFTYHDIGLRAVEQLVDDYLANGDVNPLKEWVYRRFGSKVDMNTIEKTLYNMTSVRNMPKEDIRNQIIFNYFNALFAEQFLSVRDKVDNGFVVGKLKGNPVEIRLYGDKATYNSQLNIQHKAFFVEDSEVLNYWGRYRYAGGMNVLSDSIRRGVNRVIKSKKDDNPSYDALEDLLFGGAYKRMLDRLRNIIKGQFIFDENEIIRFEDDAHRSARFDLCNVSEGVKGFGVLGVLLSQKVLGFEDVLILDEPEVHLHPSWQLKFAEFIVLLQHEFNLTVLLTTHSSMFLFALQLYARKYKMLDKLNAYEIIPDSNFPGFSVVRNHDGVTDDVDDAILSFVATNEELSRLIDEVNMEEK